MIAPALARLGPMDDAGEVLTIVVEMPKGSRNTYEFDHETGTIFLDRMLFTSMQYPADHGFIDGTPGQTAIRSTRSDQGAHRR